MLLSQITQFDTIDFHNLEIPQFVIDIESQYNRELSEKQYILEQGQYDEYTSKWARVYDWYCLQFARATYLTKNLENRLKMIMIENKPGAPETMKTNASKERWVQENVTEYMEAFALLAQAEGYYVYFEGKKDSTKIKHYNCKGMSSSIDRDKPIGGSN